MYFHRKDKKSQYFFFLESLFRICLTMKRGPASLPGSVSLEWLVIQWSHSFPIVSVYCFSQQSWNKALFKGSLCFCLTEESSVKFFISNCQPLVLYKYVPWTNPCVSWQLSCQSCQQSKCGFGDDLEKKTESNSGDKPSSPMEKQKQRGRDL